MGKILPELYEQKKIDLSGLGVRSFAWDRETILRFLSDQTCRDFVVLGGDVIEKTVNGYRHRNENWYIEGRNPDEPIELYADRSRKKAINYISAYPDNPNVSFAPVITSEITAGL
jgi:hypothetical protein